MDASPPVRRILKRNAKRFGLSNVESVAGGFLSYHHDGELADLVYPRNALHQLPDFWKVLALERMAAVLKSGGRLFLRDLVYSFDPDETERLCCVVRRRGQVFRCWLDAGRVRCAHSHRIQHLPLTA